jgi:processive 1,2-diacylglycerol beta-glucosyltransferase
LVCISSGLNSLATVGLEAGLVSSIGLSSTRFLDLAMSADKKHKNPYPRNARLGRRKDLLVMEHKTPRILIVTAAFGEGHNSAARHLALALESAGAIARVADPCLLGLPGFTALVNRAYRIVTERFPWLWGRIYRSADRCDFSRRRLPVMRVPERMLDALIDEFRPSALVTTYPIYPYFMKRIPQGVRGALPVFIVVTDSIEINAAWTRAPGDWWLVTDAFTRDRMVAAGSDPRNVVDTGFPVHPVFASLTRLAADAEVMPFRVLYFATANASMLAKHGRALLSASPVVRLTIVLGRNARRLCPAALRLKREHPGRVRLLGWTRRVPQLLASHHLAVGKAGGATVHEAIAACCPMLIHHLVPGQEEGNLRLLELIGGGALADSPAGMKRRVESMLADDAALWRGMKHALARHARDSGASMAARFILQNTPAAGGNDGGSIHPAFHP